MGVIGTGGTVNIPNPTSNFFKMSKEIEKNDFPEIFVSEHR